MYRRDFLQRLAAGAATLGASAALYPSALFAQAASPTQLAIVGRTLEIKGKAASVYGLMRPDGAQHLALDAGSSFDVLLVNQIEAPTLIHWHGLTPPWPMDGVPDNPAAALPPAGTRRYTFPVGAGGTHWMHAHTLQEQNLLAAPLIVRSAADRERDEQEVVILLHDFSFTPAEELLAKLKGSSGERSAVSSRLRARILARASRAAASAVAQAYPGPPSAIGKMASRPSPINFKTSPSRASMAGTWQSK